MNNICIGILAHVDAGKTSTAEAILCNTGVIRNPGRVDHKDTFLDTNRLERERGITIFSKQAVFDLPDFHVSFLDTPGHMDFSAEMERTLSVLDYAILVISAPDGIQAHTSTLWELLKKYAIPTFIWVNKMDICDTSEESILRELQQKLHPSCVCIDKTSDEDLALSDDDLFDRYLKASTITKDDKARLVSLRRIFPVCFGSAVKSEGIDELLSQLNEYMLPGRYYDEFGAKVYKITHDKNTRLTWRKITGKSLKVRSQIGSDKVTQIRIYNADRYEAKDEVFCGEICCVTGLESCRAGQGLGMQSDAPHPTLEPVQSYELILNSGDPHDAYLKLSSLADEDPMLRIAWNQRTQTTELQIMGQVQTEVLEQIISDRYGIDAKVGKGQIMYRETVASPVEGVGHFEPLRHYAEVHLLIEPLPCGTGTEFASDLSTDILETNWQRLILTNLAEKTHLGVLTGSPLTDVRITLTAGKAHLKHTEGGDFRQATYRAVRQGLMKAENILLEPYYDFTLTVPSEYTGRAISDIKAMNASFDNPRTAADEVQITGKAPASEMNGYQSTLLSYSKGKGRLSCRYAGHYPCHNTEKIIESIAYDPDKDIENTADSVFCSHGAGINVKWDKVEGVMHIESGLVIKGNEIEHTQPKPVQRILDYDEKELEEIMRREFGPIKRPKYSAARIDFSALKRAETEIKPEYILIDGYNLLHSMSGKEKLISENLDAARESMLNRLANYRAFRGCNMIVVFDAYKRKDNPGSKDAYKDMNVVFTPDGQSADFYIEKLIRETGGSYSVKVVTSDYLIQLAALRSGVVRISSKEFLKDIAEAECEISKLTRKEKSETTIGELINH